MYMHVSYGCVPALCMCAGLAKHNRLVWVSFQRWQMQSLLWDSAPMLLKHKTRPHTLTCPSLLKGPGFVAPCLPTSLLPKALAKCS